MISVFTPSHDTKYLRDAWRSLEAQTRQDFEWVVLLNGPAADTNWKVNDPRVKVFRTDATGIGNLKAQAVWRCRGDVLVELDHDDELLPQALEIIADVFSDHPDVSLVYSDTAQIDEQGNPDMSEFDSSYGWSYYFHGKYKVARSFDPHPHNVSYIWYAPNHVRAFTREAYDAAGGYNRDLKVLDDQDLMARLYQQGRFYHVRKPLYLQRMHKDNSQKDPALNSEIQWRTTELYSTTIESAMLAWCKRRGLKALDLGAAHNKKEGYLGVDLNPGEGVDIVGNFLDLNLPNNSVGLIRAVDFLEHLPDKQATMEKIYGLLAHGGMLLSMTPSTDGRGAFQDPTHVSYWNENAFWYFGDPEYAKFAPSKVNFQISALYTNFPSAWHQDNKISYVTANLIANKANTRDFGGRLNI